MRILATFALLACASCAPFPELDDTVDQEARDAPYPTLVNISALNAAIGPEPTLPLAEIESSLNELDATADALRGPVVDDESRSRMEEGVR